MNLIDTCNRARALHRAAATTMLNCSAHLISGLLLVTMAGPARAEDPATITPLPAASIEARPVANPAPTTQGSDAETQDEYTRRPGSSHRADIELKESIQWSTTDRSVSHPTDPPPANSIIVPSAKDPDQAPSKDREDSTNDAPRQKTDDGCVHRAES